MQMVSDYGNSNDRTESDDYLKIDVEYCGACDYGGHCLALAKTIRSSTPNARIFCKRGRQGSFEIVVNNKLIYSKLQTMALPDYEEVAQVVNDVSKGSEPREIKGLSGKTVICPIRKQRKLL